jgi:adenine-specific DNA-methyltransferase
MLEQIAAGNIWFGKDGTGVPRIKKFLNEGRQGLTPETLWRAEDVGTNDSAKRALVELFGGAAVFDTPKPVELMQNMIDIASDPEMLVCDFFAGTAPTAEAVLAANARDGGMRRFIMVQLPEPCAPDSEAMKLGFATIADVGKERLRRVIAQMQAENEGKMDLHPDEDLGLKCYRLARSNFKPWQPFADEDLTALQLRFNEAETPLIEGWQPEYLLTEVLLLQGFPLDSRVARLPAFAHNRVLRVTSDLIAHHLTICLDTHLHEATLASLDLTAEDVFVCLDSALDDEAKLRLADRCNLKVI